MRKILWLFSFIFVIFFISSCEGEQTTTYSVNEIIESISIGYSQGDSQDYVTNDLSFPTGTALDSNITISWNSESPTIISNSGEVNRANEDVLVNISYTVDYLEQTFSSILTFKVIADLDDIETSYEINYYFENIENEQYTLTNSIEIDSFAIENVFINPEIEQGFTLNTTLSTLTGRTSASEVISLNVYFDRNIYDIRLYDTSILIDTIQVKYGDTITIENPTKQDFTFVEWRAEFESNAFDFTQPILSDVTLNAVYDHFYSGDYYQGSEGLTGDELITFLHQISNATFSGVTYGDARYMLDDTDVDPTNPNNVILVYLGTSISSNWDSGATWNREHVWPQSKLGVSADNSIVNAASDLHNLKPSDPIENSSRSNKFFGYTTTFQTYEPRDEVKGDIARILFYMDIMYNELSLIYANDGNVYEMGNLEVLLAWHELDPVDVFESNRNNVIESLQGNRNPFIDHPEFVNDIYIDDDQLSTPTTQAILGSMITMEGN
jgi:endonuclease I